jgi:hypothetical protein
MPKPPPPMRVVAVSLIFDWLKDWRVELALSGAIVLTAATLVLLMPAPLEEAAKASPGGARPQSMTVDARGTAPAVLARLAPGKLPPPVAGQRKPPCHPIFEKEFSGGCWLPLAVEECPAESGGHLHEGKCYLRALAPARQPSSGEPSTRGVAEP